MNSDELVQETRDRARELRERMWSPEVTWEERQEMTRRAEQYEREAER